MQGKIIDNYDRYGKIAAYKYILPENIGADKNSIAIEIRKSNSFDYTRIYEKIITKEYENQNQTLKSIEKEKVTILEKIPNDDVTEILSFISYDKRALSVFNDYLKERSLSSEQTKEKIVKKEFDFEELTEKIINPYGGSIKEFYVETKKGINIYERNIRIKIDNEWRNIYYTLFDDYTTISEMVMELSSEQIEIIKSFISGKALNEFEIYLKRCSKHNNPSKKY